MRQELRALIIAGIFWLACIVFIIACITNITPPVLLDSPADSAGQAGKVVTRIDTVFVGWTIYKGKPGYLIITKETKINNETEVSNEYD